MYNQNQTDFFGMPMNAGGGTEGMSPSYNNQFMDYMGMNNYGGAGSGSTIPSVTGGAGGSGLSNASLPSPGGAGGGNGWWSTLFGGTNEDGSQFGGAAMPALALGKGIFDGYMGMKQYGLAKKQLKESKRQFNKNYGNQVQTTNTQLRDRQKVRYDANPDFYKSPDQYMKENRVGD